MPVDEITSTNSVVATVLQNRDRTPAQQAAVAVNEAIRSLNFVPPSAPNPLFNEPNPTLTALIESQNLTPVQEAALAVNEAINSLNFVPPSPTEALLINETSPALATLVEAQNLTLAQDVAATVNETFQALTTPLVSPESPNFAVGGANAAQNPAPGPVAASLANAPATGVATAIATQGLNLTTPTTTPAQTTTPATETTVSREEPNPTPLAAGQPVLDRNPIAVPVYEIRDPKPAPPEPKPRKKEVSPPPPIGRVRPVDRLVLRREWERRREHARREEVQPRPLLAERSIREMVGRANEDLAANGLPLRLVLARNNEGYCLDIYDCSDDAVCRLSQEVHLDLNELLTILDNLQHETGLIVNINT